MSEIAELSARIKATIIKTLAVDADKVTDDSLLVEDLGADSLDMAELAMALQEEFGVELSDEQLTHIRTVRDAITAIAPASKTQS